METGQSSDRGADRLRRSRDGCAPGHCGDPRRALRPPQDDPLAAPAGSRRGVLHHRSPDARPGQEWGPPRQATPDHDAGHRRTPGRGPDGPRLHRTGTQHPVGCGLHLLPDLGRVRLRRVRRRRLRPTNRGLACRHRPAHRPGADPAPDRAVGPRSARHPDRTRFSCCTTPTRAASTPRSGSPSTSSWPASHHRSAQSGTPTTTP
jgi:hypothetical protein